MAIRGQSMDFKPSFAIIRTRSPSFATIRTAENPYLYGLDLWFAIICIRFAIIRNSVDIHGFPWNGKSVSEALYA